MTEIQAIIADLNDDTAKAAAGTRLRENICAIRAQGLSRFLPELIARAKGKTLSELTDRRRRLDNPTAGQVLYGIFAICAVNDDLEFTKPAHKIRDEVFIQTSWTEIGRLGKGRGCKVTYSPDQVRRSLKLLEHAGYITRSRSGYDPIKKTSTLWLRLNSTHILVTINRIKRDWKLVGGKVKHPQADTQVPPGGCPEKSPISTEVKEGEVAACKPHNVINKEGTTDRDEIRQDMDDVVDEDFSEGSRVPRPGTDFSSEGDTTLRKVVAILQDNFSDEWKPGMEKEVSRLLKRADASRLTIELLNRYIKIRNVSCIYNSDWHYLCDLRSLLTRWAEIRNQLAQDELQPKINDAYFNTRSLSPATSKTLGELVSKILTMMSNGGANYRPLRQSTYYLGTALIYFSSGNFDKFNAFLDEYGEELRKDLLDNPDLTIQMMANHPAIIDHLPVNQQAMNQMVGELKRGVRRQLNLHAAANLLGMKT